ncbi:sugar transferase [Rhodococcus aerolatus]
MTVVSASDAGAHRSGRAYDHEVLGPVAEPPAALETPAQRRTRWERSYARRLVVTDVLVVLAAVAVAHGVRFGIDPDTVSRGDQLQISVGLALMWVASLALGRTRDERIIGNGPDEYRRVARTVFHLFGLVAIASLLFQLAPARGYLAIAFPLGLVGLVLSRHHWRRWLVRRRAEGLFMSTVLVVGSRRSAEDMAASCTREPGSGYRVVGVCVPGGGATEPAPPQGPGVAVLGSERSIVDALRSSRADTVAVTGADRLGHAAMRALAWDLQELDIDLVVSPGVVDVAGPRLTVRPVAGQPLMHVEEPQYAGANQFIKSGFDVVVTLFALLALSPLLVVAAAAVRLSSRGPVIYRSERMGLDGEPFEMLKFRTMVDGADGMLGDLAAAGAGNEVLFKMRADPRVTRVGRVLRQLSLDELPQLWNVLIGDMSLVGPRPPLRREVETYSGDVRRRLLVKPGITGLWQVSGRSDLSWEESVRLDLSYVENWSMVQDLIIIWRTVNAVLRGKGAY